MRQEPQTVYIVDDDAAVRDSLALLLELKGFRARAFDSAESFLAALDPAWSGCVVMDLRMPGMDGIRLQEELVRRGVPLPAVIVTAHGDIAAARKTLKSGAVDFIEKPVDDEQLLAAVHAALDLEAERRTQLKQAEELATRLERLTGREREVLDMVVAGRHNREVAAALGISPRTVEVYKARMMEKLQVRRLPDLIRLVMSARDASETPAQRGST
jgi:two-component system, LuxR family, response regulator FixJ